MTLTTLLLISFSAYGLSSLLVNEDGPYLIFERLRNRFGIFRDENDDTVIYKEEYNIIQEILACQYCAGTWMVFFSYIVYLILPQALLLFASIGLLFAILKYTEK